MDGDSDRSVTRMDRAPQAGVGEDGKALVTTYDKTYRWGPTRAECWYSRVWVKLSCRSS